METMLSHTDSPMIRCIGFLYLRYATDPEQLYNWCQPFLHDDESVNVTAKGHVRITIGEYVRKLLTELNYYGTRLPRLPTLIERGIKDRLAFEDEKEARAKKHMSPSQTSRIPVVELLTEGMTIKALYGDEENPVTWYPCVIDKVVLRDELSGEMLRRPRFKVTFTEYGNSEIVTLGEVDLMDTVNHSGRRTQDYLSDTRPIIQARNHFDGHGNSVIHQPKPTPSHDSRNHRGYSHQSSRCGLTDDQKFAKVRSNEVSRSDVVQPESKKKRSSFTAGKDHIQVQTNVAEKKQKLMSRYG